jgi:hypothetical protein
MPPLVEFAVIRQEHLRHDTEQPAAMDRDAAIVEPSPPTQRRADDKDRKHFLAGGGQPLELRGDRVEHRVLKQQVVDRIGRQAQLGKHHQRDAGLVAPRQQFEHLVGVRRRLGHGDPRHAGGDPDEFVAVGREERGHGARRSRGVHGQVIWVMTRLSISGVSPDSTSGGAPHGTIHGFKTATTDP